MNDEFPYGSNGARSPVIIEQDQDLSDPNKRNQVYLRIAVSLPVRGTFSYAVPAELLHRAQIGCRVLVPFRNRKVTGYILGFYTSDGHENAKEILEVLDSEPLFHEPMVAFFEWMADYYIHPLGRVIQSALPGGLNRRPYKTAYLTEKGFDVLTRLPKQAEEKKMLFWLKVHPGEKPPWSFDKFYRMAKRGWLVIEERMGKRQAGPLMRKFVRSRPKINLHSILEGENYSLKAKNEVAFLETCLHSDAVLLSELTAKFKNGAYLVQKWIKNGVLESFTKAVFRDPSGKIIFPSSPPQKLYEQQKNALSRINKWLDQPSFCSCLLYGVTDSGKTEVYYQAIERLMDSGRQAILMAPEISLAVYLESIFRSRMGDRVAIYHSGLSPGERYDQWIRMARGDVDLVIGARSALFAPLPRLGMIIVDEEHDPAYKQENPPRYHARDAAVVRAKIQNALVILGSGTPSVQSYQNSVRGTYHLLSMPGRIENRPLPDVDIVDMKEGDESKYRDDMLGSKLKAALEQNLANGNQAILFLNRRGFHRLFICRFCGNAIRCPNCDVSLTHHMKENRLSCHYCGFFSEPTVTCPACGKDGVRSYGFGTERLEHELKEVFAGAHISRMDTDSVRRKGQAFKILKKFSDHDIDILVGTQMITKGYDFPNVTLVGVIAADLSLGFPDFRAGERTFQLLSQVAGRAGRGSQKGRVIIQTFNPDHYAIRTAMAHDYETFFEKERDLRQQLEYPPFSHLTCLRLRGNNEVQTKEAAHLMGTGIRRILADWSKRGREIQVLGPAEATISRLKGKYRWQILLKSRNASLLRHLVIQVEGLSRKILKARGVQLVIDIDPYQMN